MSQAVFAWMLNVSPRTVRSWDQGERLPWRAALRLLQILDARPNLVCQIVGIQANGPSCVPRRKPGEIIKGTVKNGQVVFDEPAGLPDGPRVKVVPVEAGSRALGQREGDWPTTLEGIAALLARM